MITSYDHALRTQTRRLIEGGDGVSKAVRRYLLKNHRDDYRKMKNKLMREAWEIANPNTETDEVAA